MRKGLGARWLSFAAATFFFSLLALLFFHGLLTGDLAFRDPYLEFYPLRLLWDWVRTGHFPLWNPYPGLGAPHFMGLWYPLNGPLVFVLGLSPRYAIRLYTLIHYPLAGLGMFGLLHTQGARKEAAAAGAIAYAFSGYLVSMHYAQNLLPALALMPAVVALAVRAGREGRLRWWLSAGALTGIIALGGDPQGFVITVIISILAALVLGFPRTGITKFFLGALAYGLVSFASGAAEILPALVNLAHSSRAQGFDLATATTWSFHPARIIEFFLAQPFGSFWPVDRYWGDFMERYPLSYPMSLSPYLGAWTALAVALAWKRPRPDARVLFFSLLAVLFLALALGRFSALFKLLSGAIPGFGVFRFPEKYLIGVTLALAVLCGLGTDYALDPRLHPAVPARKGLAALWPGAAFLSAAVLVAAIDAPARAPIGRLLAPLLAAGGGVRVTPEAAAADLAASLARAFALFGVAVFIFRLSKGSSGRMIAFAPALFLFLDLWQANAGLAPTLPGLYARPSYWANRIWALENNQQSDPKPSSPLTAPPWCASSPGLPCQSAGRFRIFRENDIALPPALFKKDQNGRLVLDQEVGLHWQRDTLKPNLPVMDGLENFGGIIVLTDRRLQWMRRSVAHFDQLPLFNVKYAIIPEEYESDLPGATLLGHYQGASLFRFERVLPRAYWVPEAVLAATDEEFIQAFNNYDLHRLVILEPRPGAEGLSFPMSKVEYPTLPVPATITAYFPNRVELTVTAPAEGWLVLNDAYAPGWSATVDGQKADIFRANGLVRSVRVSEGEHRAVYTYWPPRQSLGLVLSALALALGVFPHFRRDRGRLHP
jgi:hypothetical protein